MSLQLYIREWGEIICADEVFQKSMDELHINQSTWQELAKYAEDSKHKYLYFVNSKALKVKNYVGVITTQDGTQIEILPKHKQNIFTSETAKQKELESSRSLIWHMLNIVYKVSWVESLNAQLINKKQNLHELLIYRFLLSVRHIVKRGVRSDYHHIEAHENFLKGQLQLQKQINEPPHRQHLLHIAYDVFSPNRAENRLIHSALLQVKRFSKSNSNQKLIRELLHFFDGVPITNPNQYHTDFKKWHTNAQNRSMCYYQGALPWVRLILNRLNPFTQKGINAGISFLLPMEELFESYVAKMLAIQMPNGYKLKTKERKHHLAEQNGRGVFQLEPDMAVYEGDKPVCVLDTKWKLINEKAVYENGNQDKKKDIAQGDMYQMFAYGKKYEVQKAVLIYPQWEKFKNEFNFKLDADLQLDVVPFPLDKDVKISDFKNSLLS